MWAFIFWFVSCGPSGSHSVFLLLLFDLVFLLLLRSYSIFLFIKRFHLVRQKLVFLFLVIKRFLETLCLFWLGCPQFNLFLLVFLLHDLFQGFLIIGVLVFFHDLYLGKSIIV